MIRICPKCAHKFDDFPSGAKYCDSCRGVQKKCSHKNTQGKSNWQGTTVEFHCVACGALVKTVHNNEDKLPKKWKLDTWDYEYEMKAIDFSEDVQYPKNSGASMVCVKCGAYTKKAYHVAGGGCLCLYCYNVKQQAITDKAKQAGIDPPKPFLLPKKEPSQPMFNGEIRKLPKANSPMWTEQWAAQGSAKTPYIVSRKSLVNSYANGAMTDEGWACSCKDFTSHTPRADCKHICWVKKAEGILMTAPPVAALPKDQQEAFKKFLLQQAQAGNPVEKIKTKPFITQGRRFR